MLAAYRLFQNKHSPLEANRAGVQWKSCAFVRQMAPTLQGNNLCRKQMWVRVSWVGAVNERPITSQTELLRMNS
jgi:hypothetical protein